jgi:hypothetical protein
MKKLIIVAALMAAVGLVAFSVQAAPDQPAAQGAPAAQADVLYQCPMHPEVISPQPGKCPKCGMDLVAKSRTQIMQEAHQAAGLKAPGAGESAMGAAPSMAAMHGLMLRQRVMLAARIDNADPAAMLAMSDSLKLTKDQTAKLEAIAADARKKALAVLTKEQKATLETVPAEPASLMDLHRAAAPQSQPQLPAGHPALPAAK